MAKLGILTFFNADNYGALLQCYALSEFCKNNNNEVEVINYHSKKMFTWKYQLKRIIFKTTQNKKFDLNRKVFLKQGSVKEKYDIVIVGSDQVWNPSIIKEDTYWIEPEVQCQKLISYAASLGKCKLNKSEETFLRTRNFERYTWISVREKTGQELLKKIGVKSEVVCDPTLLFYHESEKYDDIIEKSKLKKKDYIFVYSLEKSEKMDQISKMLAEKYGYRIISAHPANDRTQCCDEFVADSDICDFLYLIKNAKIIITNSFHGLAFSFIFRKDVFCVSHTTLGSRQTDLIEESGLDYESLETGVYHIHSYTNDKKMKDYVTKSKLMLKREIQCV